MQFLGEIGQNNSLVHEPLCVVGAPSSGKSWIRHWVKFISCHSFNEDGNINILIVEFVRKSTVKLKKSSECWRTPVVYLGFPRQGAPTHKVGFANILFGQLFSENRMKMKEIRPRRGSTRPWCPLRSADGRGTFWLISRCPGMLLVFLRLSTSWRARSFICVTWHLRRVWFYHVPPWFYSWIFNWGAIQLF